MEPLSIEDALKGLCVEKDTAFNVNFRDTDIAMDLLTGAEATMVRSHVDFLKDVSMNEYSAENLLYAIKKIGDTSFNAMEMTDEQKDRARELILGMPNLMLSFLYQSYLQKEMEFDASVGVAQLRNLLLVGVLSQLAVMVDFPVLLSDVAKVVAEKETPVEIMEMLIELRDAKEDAEMVLGEAAEAEETVEVGVEVPLEVEAEVSEHQGVPIDPTMLGQEGPEEERAERTQVEPAERSEPSSITDVTNPDGSLGMTAEQKTMAQIRDRKKRTVKDGR